jgi:2,3-diketo-5-methylthio-1-phosphopentane phosphatase
MSICCDFDGTVMMRDVGDAFFERYAGDAFRVRTPEFVAGTLSAKSLFEAYANGLDGYDPADLAEFCAAFEMRPDFPAFVDWARMHRIPLCIVSDGLDLYIREILNQHKLDLPVHANTLTRRQGRWAIDRPWSDPECDRCGCCKRNRLLVDSPDDAMIVVIGDGLSDYCAARHADLVFARGPLETWCREQNITFRSFRSFSDILSVLEPMRSDGKMRRSRQAAVLRSSVWMRG